MPAYSQESSSARRLPRSPGQPLAAPRVSFDSEGVRKKIFGNVLPAMVVS